MPKLRPDAAHSLEDIQPAEAVAQAAKIRIIDQPAERIFQF
jgi:hypothetical protein